MEKTVGGSDEDARRVMHSLLQHFSSMDFRGDHLFAGTTHRTGIAQAEDSVQLTINKTVPGGLDSSIRYKAFFSTTSDAGRTSVEFICELGKAGDNRVTGDAYSGACPGRQDWDLTTTLMCSSAVEKPQGRTIRQLCELGFAAAFADAMKLAGFTPDRAAPAPAPAVEPARPAAAVETPAPEPSQAPAATAASAASPPPAVDTPPPPENAPSVEAPQPMSGESADKASVPWWKQ